MCNVVLVLCFSTHTGLCLNQINLSLTAVSVDYLKYKFSRRLVTLTLNQQRE